MAASDAALAAAAAASAAALENDVLADSNDEDDEVDDFGAGAIERARLSAAGSPHVEEVAYVAEANERAARRRTTRNISAHAMSEQSWTANEKVAARFIRFLAAAYGDINEPGGMTMALFAVLPAKRCPPLGYPYQAAFWSRLHGAMVAPMHSPREEFHKHLFAGLSLLQRQNASCNCRRVLIGEREACKKWVCAQDELGRIRPICPAISFIDIHN